MKIINKIQQVLLLILIYLLCTRSKNKYDEVLIVVLGVVTFIRNIYYREYFLIRKEIVYNITIWSVLITISFIKMRFFYSAGDYINLYQNIMIGNFLLFIILTQIDFSKILKKIFVLINVLSLYSIYKGIDFIKNNGFFVRGYAWGNPNYYSMLLGIFMIISFASFLYEKKLKYKMIYLVLNLLQFFMLVSVGQSRNVYFAMVISYLLATCLFYYEEIKLKNFFKLFSYVCMIVLLFYCLTNYTHLRVTNISLNKFLDNPRILIWKKVLFEEKFNILLGKGFAYYTMNKFKDSVGVYIWAAHNDSIEFLVTQGVFSMLCYWLFILYSLKELWKKYLIEQNLEVLIAFIIVIYFFQIGMLDLPFYHKRIAEFLFLFIAIGINKNKKIINKKRKLS